MILIGGAPHISISLDEECCESSPHIPEWMRGGPERQHPYACKRDGSFDFNTCDGKYYVCVASCPHCM
jgi:hypothetical protein